MFNLAKRAAPAPAPAAAENSQFAVASYLEITQILSSIMRQGALVTASPGSGSFFLTSIVEIDQANDTLLLECGRQQPQIEQVLAAQKLECSTALDKVKIEFTCNRIEVTGSGANQAFKMPLPRSMLRLQRREHFRMEVPMSAEVKCTMLPLDADFAQSAKIELLVRDISCGGIAVITPPDLFTPELGKKYNALIGLPGSNGVQAVVQARNAFMITLPNGKVTQRSGFAFVRPAESLLSTIQRFIMNLERSRRIKDSGR